MSQGGEREPQSDSKKMAMVNDAASETGLPKPPEAARSSRVESKIDQLFGTTAPTEQEQGLNGASQETVWRNTKMLRFLPAPIGVQLAFRR